jgi:flagellar hook-associated protein 1 FlgK
MAGIFGIGVSGIQAAQMGLQVAQHNITNANTPGYNRQSVVQATAIPVGFGSGFVGNGTQVTTISRQYNQFLTDQVRQSDTQLSSLDTYFGQIQVVDDLLADANAGVSPALQDFFKGLQQVVAAPASLPARQSMVSSAQALVSRLQGADQRVSDLYGQVNQQISDNVSTINTYGKQIAALNQQITVAESAVNQPANDLLDQRDQIISELNKLIKVQTVPMGASGIQVMVGKGQVLVMGSQSNQLSAVRSSADPSRITVALDMGAGNQELPENIITGGKLGGLMSFRSGSLDTAVNSLGKVAASLALTFNAQHANGMDLLGNSAGDSGFVAGFFTLPKPKVIPSNTAGPTVTASFTPPELTSNADTGNYFSNITNSDYKLEYLNSGLSLTRVSDGTSWKGQTLSEINTQINDSTDSRGAQGITLVDNGAAYSEGDTFMIQPTREMAKNITVDSRVAGDVRLIAAALPVRASVGLTNQGTMSVAVSRVREDAVNAAAITFPVKIGIDANQTFTLFQADGMTAIDPNNPSPLEMTMYPADGSTPQSFTVDYSVASWPAVQAGATYEIANGNSRISFTIKGSPKSGDTFQLANNFEVNASTGKKEKIGVSDTGNILLLGKLQTQNTSDGASTSYQGVYAQMVSDIGNKAREVEVTKTAQKALVDQAGAARDAESGVNLDEEAANLLKFQQLYQASARSISIGQKIFDELLSIAGA